MFHKLTALTILMAASSAIAETPAEVKKAAAVQNRFALDLYQRVRHQPGNLFLSPSSISTALNMTALGAAGSTGSEMNLVLRWPADGAADHAAVAMLMAWLDDREDAQIDIANALWVHQGFPLARPYVDLASSHYGSRPHTVDFARDPGGAAKQINEWVDGETHGKIKELFAPGTLSGATRLVLTNAIYFKGTWARPFDERNTRERDFHLAAGRRVAVPFMNQQGVFPFVRQPGGSVLELPYGAGGLVMDILMSDGPGGLHELEAGLTPATLQERLDGLGAARVMVAVPKFKIDATLRLKEALRAMGMVSAFTPTQADFSGLTGSSTDLYLEQVVHRAYVQVDEEGTVAAGATGVVGAVTSMPPSFVADRPFLFLIRDTLSGAILFIGRVSDPS